MAGGSGGRAEDVVYAGAGEAGSAIGTALAVVSRVRAKIVMIAIVWFSVLEYDSEVVKSS